MATGRRNTAVGFVDDEAMEKQALGDALGRLSQQRVKGGQPTTPGPVDVGGRTNEPTSHTFDAPGLDSGVPAPTGPQVIDGTMEDYISGVGMQPDKPNAPVTTTSGTSGPRDYGYVAGAEDLGWGDTSRLRGFNTAEWGPGGTQGYHDISYKNTFGKLATNFPPNPDGLRALVASEDFARLFPGAKLIDHPTDPKIDFGDGNPVDVLFQTDKGWQWLPEGSGGGVSVTEGSAGAGLPGGGIGVGAQGSDDSILDEIMASIDAMAKGEEDPMVKKSIGTQLGELSEAARASAGGALKGGTGSSANPKASRTGFTGRTGGVR